ncbi:MAG: YIP1 family protein [Roseovarius sp.]|nr:YIP1 family protein [Roseovarius sp.]
MPVTRDIVATYRRPRRVVRRLLDAGPREDRALVILLAACGVIFIAQWPRLAREAHLTGQELNPMLGGALLAWIFIAPLILYTLALISHGLARMLGAKGTGYGARVALFWALLATSPIMLLHGLVAGFIGPGPGLQVVGLIWLSFFGWFWVAGWLEAEWSKA